LHSPDAVAAVPAVLLEHPGFAGSQLPRQLASHLFQGGVSMCLAAPSEVARSIQDVFGPELQNDIRMRTDENAGRCDVAKHRIQRRSVAPAFDGIDPYQNAVDLAELFSNFLAEVIIVDRRFCVDSAACEGPEEVREPAALDRRVPPRLTIARAENRESTAMVLRHGRRSSDGFSSVRSGFYHVRRLRRLREAWRHDRARGRPSAPRVTQQIRPFESCVPLNKPSTTAKSIFSGFLYRMRPLPTADAGNSCR
jgi:hypothetical protein